MKFTTRLRVRYAETDQMGVVYHANYLAWFEIGRVEMMRSLGFTYQQLEREGRMLPVVEVSCRYRSPARYDDELLLETQLTAMRGPILKFAYQLWRPGFAGECAASGSTDDSVTRLASADVSPESALGAVAVAEEKTSALLLCDAMTTHVVVDRELKKDTLPARYTEALLQCLG